MRFVLDACTIIYLVKANLFDFFLNFSDFPIFIDTSVFHEVVTQGKINNYADASIAETLFKKYKIPVIAIDISEKINIMNDPGETSCYILVEDCGTFVTSDIRAYNKFKSKRLPVIRLEHSFYELQVQNKISKTDFFTALDKLLKVGGIKIESILFYKNKLLNESVLKGDNNE